MELQKLSKRLIILLVIVCLQVSVFGQEEKSRPMAIGLKIGTTGPGLEVSKQICDAIDIRLGSTYFKTTMNMTPNNYDVDIQADMTIVSQTVSVLGDFYNGEKRIFRFTGGLVYNLSSIFGSANTTESYTMGEVRIEAEDVGQITYDFTPNLINPYVGVGFGSIIPQDKKLSLSADVGMLYIGPPNVTLEADGFVAPTASQEDLIRSNISQMTLLPVLSLQLNYKF